MDMPISGACPYDVLIGEKAFTGHLHDLRESAAFGKSSERTETSPCSSERATNSRIPLAVGPIKKRVGEAGLAAEPLLWRMQSCSN